MNRKNSAAVLPPELPGQLTRQLNELEGFIGLGMQKEALQLSRVLLRSRPAHPKVLSETLTALLIRLRTVRSSSHEHCSRGCRFPNCPLRSPSHVPTQGGRRHSTAWGGAENLQRTAADVCSRYEQGLIEAA